MRVHQNFANKAWHAVVVKMTNDLNKYQVHLISSSDCGTSLVADYNNAVEWSLWCSLLKDYDTEEVRQ
jgi:hypothetical protein